MNTSSPFILPGLKPPGGRSGLYFKVLTILTAHVVVIGGMLLQGCKDTSTPKDQAKQDGSVSPTADATPTAAVPPANVAPTLAPNISNTSAGIVTSSVPSPQSMPVAALAPPAKPADLAPLPAPVEAKEYVVAKGDTFAAIARKHGLSLKALIKANPGVNAQKLRIGQKLHLSLKDGAGTA